MTGGDDAVDLKPAALHHGLYRIGRVGSLLLITVFFLNSDIKFRYQDMTSSR